MSFRNAFHFAVKFAQKYKKCPKVFTFEHQKMIKCVAVSVFLPNLLLRSTCLVEHITVSGQSKGSANRQVTLPNAPHKPQNACRSMSPVGEIEYQYRILSILSNRVVHDSRCFVYYPSSKLCLNPEKSCGCFTNSAFSCSTRNPYSNQTKCGKQPSTAFRFQYQPGRIITLQYPSQTTPSPGQ